MPGKPHRPLRALVMGGSSGIGLAVTRRLLRDDAKVVVVGRDPERGAAALATLNNKNATFRSGDAGDPVQCQDLVDGAVDYLGGIDALFSCAGGNPMPRLLKDIPLDDLMGQVNRSLAPTILPARAVLPVMSTQGYGSIVCIASDAGKVATPGETAIGAAMAAIIMFCRTMANEVKRQGVRVNCITPSIVEGTELHDRLMDDPFSSRLFGKAKTLAHLGVAQPEDLAELAAFLGGPLSAKITGQAISVSGGISAI